MGDISLGRAAMEKQRAALQLSPTKETESALWSQYVADLVAAGFKDFADFEAANTAYENELAQLDTVAKTQALKQALAAEKEAAGVAYDAALPSFTFPLAADLRFVNVSKLTYPENRTLQQRARQQRALDQIPDTLYFWYNAKSVFVTYPPTDEGLALKAKAEENGITAMPIFVGRKATHVYGNGTLYKGTPMLWWVSKATVAEPRRSIDALCVRLLSRLGIAPVQIRGNNFKVGGRKIVSQAGDVYNGVNYQLLAVAYDFDFALGDRVFQKQTADVIASVVSASTLTPKPSVADIATALEQAMHDIFGVGLASDNLTPAETGP